MSSDTLPYLDERVSNSFAVDALSIALIGPDERRRKEAANALAGYQSCEICEISSYPPSLDDVPKLLEQPYDAVIIDLDSHPEYALELVECICARVSATVMVFSMKTDSDLLVRCMRAGAREFLTLPFDQNTVAEALVRASARRAATRAPKKAGGRLLAFLGAKGGDGVTTLACNFAVLLAQESNESTLLIDLDLPLGDAALNLGIAAEYSTINALQNASRLDSAFLSKLLVKHSTGVFVLAAPGKFPQYDASFEAIDRLVAVARQDFDNVVVDMGSRLDLVGTTLFKEGSTVYLVIQAGIAGLRNSNRLISQYFNTDAPKLEIVINRYQSRSLGVAEDQITKALARPVQWKIPNDFAAVRRMHHTATPLALDDSPISRLIRQMARCACGLPPIQEKASGFSFKSLGRSIAAKRFASEEASPAALPQPPSIPDHAGTAPRVPQSDLIANIAEDSADVSPAGYVDVDESPALLAVTDDSDLVDIVSTDEGTQEDGDGEQPFEPETPSFEDAAYARGADDEWLLQQASATGVTEEETAPVAFPETPVAAPETPVIAWTTPAPITYGNALTVSELNAMASVPGTFVYTPADGEVLPVGEHTLSVDFTPEDPAAYTAAQTTVQLAVVKATPVLKWPTPASIVYGTALSATQLNATGSVTGAFAYAPGAGDILPAGKHTLSVEFTPKDTANHKEAQTVVSIAVSKAAPVITWPVPASIAYGTGLSAIQLNATASVPGTFAYAPAMSAVLTAGVQKLSAVFTPLDSTNYAAAHAEVSIIVTKATPIITWPVPAAVSEGAVLGCAQLNATALVPGTFVYTPTAGQKLAEGTHALVVTFTPADTDDYAAVQATVLLAVNKAEPAAPLQALDAISHDLSPKSSSPRIQPQPLPVQASHAERRPAHRAIPALEKPKVKISGIPPVKVGSEPLAELALPPAEAPSRLSVKLRTGPADTDPAKASGKALVKTEAPKSPIDVGPGLDLMGSAVFEDGTTIYLVMQPGSEGLSNSSRLVSQFFSAAGPKPEIVINRYEPPSQGAPGGQSSTALTRIASSPFSRLIGQLTRTGVELSAAPEKKRGFSLKGFGRKIWARISNTGQQPSIVPPGLAHDLNGSSNGVGAVKPEGTVNIPANSAFGPSVGSLFAPGTEMPFKPADETDRTSPASAKPECETGGSAPNQQNGYQTRIYKGTAYVRGADAHWHLKDSQNAVANTKLPSAAQPIANPSGHAAAPRITELSAKPRTGPPAARPTARKLAAKAKSAAGKIAAKAVKAPPVKAVKEAPVKLSAKPAAKAVVKPVVKTAAKAAAKAKVKPVVKAKVKPVVKVAAKPSAKAAPKPLIKAVAKPAAKTPVKPRIKVSAKLAAKAPIQAPAPPKKKPAPRPSPMPVAVVKPFVALPSLKVPVPVPVTAIRVPAQMPPAGKPAPASAKEG